MEDFRFSLSMSVYKNDNPEFFRLAIESATIKQSLPPTEVVLVVDGPIPATIHKVIGELREELPIPMNIIQLNDNVGHAHSRQTGLKATKNPIVAIMDSDDICHPERFAKQIEYMMIHPDVDIVGAQITEFVGTPDIIVGSRICPEHDKDIKYHLKARCPMNLVTVVFKKDSVLAVGGFIDWYCEEDYYLWIRLTEKGFKFGNLNENLVNVRVGKKMYSRRGGVRYFKSEAKLQRYLFKHKLISFPRYIYNIAVRFVVQVAMPNSVRSWVFRHFARK
jgi:glycosyltransferase involved in cell wall biosynthesis